MLHLLFYLKYNIKVLYKFLLLKKWEDTVMAEILNGNWNAASVGIKNRSLNLIK